MDIHYRQQNQNVQSKVYTRLANVECGLPKFQKTHTNDLCKQKLTFFVIKSRTMNTFAFLL